MFLGLVGAMTSWIICKTVRTYLSDPEIRSAKPMNSQYSRAFGEDNRDRLFQNMCHRAPPGRKCKFIIQLGNIVTYQKVLWMRKLQLNDHYLGSLGPNSLLFYQTLAVDSLDSTKSPRESALLWRFQKRICNHRPLSSLPVCLQEALCLALYDKLNLSSTPHSR